MVIIDTTKIVIRNPARVEIRNTVGIAIRDTMGGGFYKDDMYKSQVFDIERDLPCNISDKFDFHNSHDVIDCALIKLNEYKVPKFEVPVIPEVKIPIYELPVIPKFEVPVIPEVKIPIYELPVIPKFEVPVIPEVKIPKLLSELNNDYSSIDNPIIFTPWSETKKKW